MQRIGLIIMIVTLWVTNAWGFPKYTDRKKALELAEVLDKGTFQSYRIASVFTKNHSDEEYYLRAILDDGSVQDWYLDDIYRWTLTDQLFLTENRILVFPSEEETDFAILDKNAFYRTVLQSQVFVKTYNQHDLLDGKSIKYAIRRFRLLEQGESLRYRTDRMGNRYRYILELENGSREILTYLDAYQLTNQGAFIAREEDAGIVLRRAFQVQGFRVLPKKLEDELRNVWRFGVEIIFNEPIPLSEDLFPFQIVEEQFRENTTGLRTNRFYLQVVLPNTEKIKDIPSIRTLEYLQHVELVTDVEHQKRSFLKAQVNPQVFQLPPYIETTGKNTIKVHFFTVMDQSVAKRAEFMAPDQPDPVLHAALIVDKNNDFEMHYLKAVEHIRSVQDSHDLQNKVSKYFLALDSLKEAALVAKTDEQISQSLAQRDVLYDVLPQMIVENTQLQIRKPTTQINHASLLEHLDLAGKITDNREILRQVRSLENVLR